MIYVSDGIRKFALEKYLTWFNVSSLGKGRGAGVELNKPALLRVVYQVPFPYKVQIGVKGERYTFCLLF